MCVVLIHFRRPTTYLPKEWFSKKTHWNHSTTQSLFPGWPRAACRSYVLRFKSYFYVQWKHTPLVCSWARVLDTCPPTSVLGGFRSQVWSFQWTVLDHLNAQYQKNGSLTFVTQTVPHDVWTYVPPASQFELGGMSGLHSELQLCASIPSAPLRCAYSVLRSQ